MNISKVLRTVLDNMKIGYSYPVNHVIGKTSSCDNSQEPRPYCFAKWMNIPSPFMVFTHQNSLDMIHKWKEKCYLMCSCVYKDNCKKTYNG